MNYLLSHPDGGHAAILVVGGAPEALGESLVLWISHVSIGFVLVMRFPQFDQLDSHPDSYVCHLKKRKGFIKLALRNG